MSPSSTRSAPQPSSSTAGFFQNAPKVGNQFFDDAALRRAFELHVPVSIRLEVEADLAHFGDRVLSPQVLGWVADAEKNVPSLRTWDSFGRRIDQLVTGEGWRSLQALGISEGIIAIPYENQQREFSRVYQFIKYHIWSASSAYVTCPSAMTDGAARLLSTHLQSRTLPPGTRKILEPTFQKLVSRDPQMAWTSGQWMTERKGGSDVSGTETLAVKAPQQLGGTGIDDAPLGPYSISGFKWFSSATDSQMTILLARTEDDKISAFYAPMRRTIPGSQETELNGVKIQRLKNKLGTRALPTAELELKDMRGYLLGTEGQGIREIATVLNITRVHNAVTAMGFWGRGLAISRAFARVRSVGGKLLMNIPAHVNTMAGQEVDYRGYMHLTFFIVYLLGVTEQATEDSARRMELASSRIAPTSEEAQLLLRVLTPTVKALTAKASIAGLAECMESLGGVGYLENEDMELNIARLFRDANVLSIWEGTTDIMASDMLKVLKGRQGAEVLKTLGEWANRVVPGPSFLQERWAKWLECVKKGDLESLKIDGRSIMTELGRLVAGVLLVADAERDNDEIAAAAAARWLGWSTDGGRTSAMDRVQWDRRIVFGTDNATTGGGFSKL